MHSQQAEGSATRKALPPEPPNYQQRHARDFLSYGHTGTMGQNEAVRMASQDPKGILRKSLTKGTRGIVCKEKINNVGRLQTG